MLHNYVASALGCRRQHATITAVCYSQMLMKHEHDIVGRVEEDLIVPSKFRTTFYFDTIQPLIVISTALFMASDHGFFKITFETK